MARSDARRRAPIGVGLIGCGGIATLRHLPALHGIAEAKLVALADLDATALERAAVRYGVERRYASAEALFEDRGVECVGVLVPVTNHAELAVAALEGGKHVLVEKPLALSVQECDRMVAAAARASGVAMVAHNLRFHRHVKRARELIAEGAIGKPEVIRTVTIGDYGEGHQDGEGIAAWKTDSAAGGGAIIEKGVHHYDLWRFLTGAEPLEVTAVATTERSYDRRAAVSATLSGGVVAQASSAYGRPPCNQVVVVGSEGRLDIDLYAFDGLRLRGPAHISGSPRSRLEEAAAALRLLPSGLADLARGGAYVRSYAGEWHHFLACARSGGEPDSSLADGREAARVAIAAARSAREGTRMRLRAGKAAPVGRKASAHLG